jgi:hypothetical protein
MKKAVIMCKLDARHWIKSLSIEDATYLENLIVEYHRGEEE